MAFLDVEQSILGQCWTGPNNDVTRRAERLTQDTGLAPALATLLAMRDVPSEEADAFLAPSLRTLLPNPRNLLDCETAATRLLQALTSKERIAIFADYDVDGGSSAALILDWLRQQNHDATLYVPDRIVEGYGPNDTAMAMLAEDHDLIICVDCGTLSHGPIAAAKGADVVVIDHHLGGETVPDCHAVVNPNRQDETSELGHLCAAAVVFLVLVEANRQSRDLGGTQPDLMGMLDLVGLATVADVAPLIGVNRAFVRQGLTIMARRARFGIAALLDQAKVETAPSAYHLGYVLGPRINAGGRIGAADMGARLLAATTLAEAQKLAAKLDAVNAERREIEAQVVEDALAQAQARGVDAPLVWAAGDGWHPGVVGIVASRLKEKTNRPSIVIGFEGDAGKGSGRSISGVDLGAAIQKLQREGDIEKGGGHKMAAGLSLSRAQLEPAMEKLSMLLNRQGAGNRPPRELAITQVLMPTAAHVDLIEKLDTAGPFGASAPSPRFAFASQQIHFAKHVGEKHLKISFGDGTGPKIDAIAFGAFETPLGDALLNHQGGRFHLAGRLEVNIWGGRKRAQLKLEDAFGPLTQ